MAHSVYKYRKGEAYPHCYKYPQVAVTADCVVFSYNGRNVQVLLIKRGGEPFKDCWAFPGGFVNPDETVEAGAARELLEETSLRTEFMRQIRVFSAPDRDPRQRTMTVPFLCLWRSAQLVQSTSSACGESDQGSVAGDVGAISGDDASDARWFDIENLPDLAFDHRQIFSEALDVLRKVLVNEDIACHLMPKTFTMPQLHRLYEQILGKKLDRRNFARKMLAENILEAACKRKDGTPSRIPSFYSFRVSEGGSISTPEGSSSPGLDLDVSQRQGQGILDAV